MSSFGATFRVDAVERAVIRVEAVQIVTSANDSWRGQWTHREWRPPALARFVELIWESEGTVTEDLDRHFPHGRIELLLNLGGGRFDLVEPTGSPRFRSTWVCGMQLGPTVTKQPRTHRVMGIRLHPAGAYALFATPLRTITNLVVELRDLVGPTADELVERCREAAAPEARFRLAAEWIAARVRDALPVQPAVAWAAAQIESRHGDIAIAQLRGETGLSKTRLAAAFREQIGVSPKLFARIVRFRRALAMVESGPTSLADVALAAGYYDQPHFNAEFREMSGLTPGELLVAYYPSGVPVPSPDGRAR
jgi:AraC-like DNA-binding protein